MQSGVHAEVIVIGTGIGGLAAAKTYLELSPETDLLLIEKVIQSQSSSEVSGLKKTATKALKPTISMAPMSSRIFPWTRSTMHARAHIPGFVLNRYFNDFADHFDLRRRIKFNTRVMVVEKLPQGWKLMAELKDSTRSAPLLYTCDKLIVSSGLASNPNPISLAGQRDFGKPVINHAQLRDEAAQLAQDPTVNQVAVVGASKTGYDAVQLMASHGKKVQWIIRESGGGAVWMAPPWVKVGGRLMQLEHLATTRFFSWLSPCIWGDFDGFGWARKLLHRTRLGRWMVHEFWEKIRMDMIDFNGYRKEEALKHLEPQESLFWSARVGVLNYPSDIHDFLRSGQVTITRKDIDRLSAAGGIHFADGTTIEADALIAITGWNLAPAIKYKSTGLPAGLNVALGIPSSDLTADDEALWNGLDEQAEKTILHQFPYLRHPPSAKIPYKQTVSPFRLYRGVAPPGLTTHSDHSLAFMKMVHSTSNMVLAETQALWVYAYLNGKINIDTKEVYQETALMSRFGKLRYPCGFSSWYPEFVYDVIPYADMLLTDVGVRKRRKATWWKEVFEEYTIHDYRGLNREWKMAQHGEKKTA
ncbi:uncharacterized protein N7459_001045 [Penicillium hispanicum]|uniref:uncharacterized protein n=1 Tax=Penicillium hispanicum TaxID=1080232 RepID=UPI00254069C9|nr:uncharacterized protein N7459_001045 [Penicillium hispanicum]KAJ5594837.1 hypothetical protein N7459_001045 [Penicillium hispanicum]